MNLRLVSARLLGTVLVIGLAAESQAGCRMATSDERWLADAYASWKVVLREDLRRSGGTPEAIMFDNRCVWHIAGPVGSNDAPSVVGGVEAVASRHHGRIVLPDGRPYPHPLLGVPVPSTGSDTVFAATVAYSVGGRFRAVAILALPSVWRLYAARWSAGKIHRSIEPRLLRVAIHEFVHTLDLPDVLTQLDELRSSIGVRRPFTDDYIEQRFRHTPTFARQIAREIELLEEALRTTDPHTRRKLAGRAAREARSRRAKHLDGSTAKLELLFLRLEGVAEWAALRALERSGANHVGAPAGTWSQRLGVALVSMLFQVSPGWQETAWDDDLFAVVEATAS